MTGPCDLRAIARALGGEVAGGQVLAPGPGHSLRDRSLSVRLSLTAPEGFVAYSHAGDDFAACRDYVKSKLGIASNGWRERSPAQPSRPHTREEADNRDRVEAVIRTIIAEMKPLRGTPGEVYMRDVRRIDTAAIANVPDAIGWHPTVLFREEGHALDGKRLGAIVAVHTDPVTARPTGGISRTYIHEGRKVAKAKGLGAAGVVRLSPDDEVLGGLFIAEGLETALTGMAIGLRPMWSTGSTAIMSKFPVLSGIDALTILADHDANGAGEQAARECASRWRRAGREVRIWAPKVPGDLNDVLGVLL